jgi:uncharacterized protein
MTQPDFEAAQDYAFTRLSQDLSPKLYYHSVWHTFKDVLPGVERLAQQLSVVGSDLLLLRTAAIYHDIGFLEVRAGHEEAGKRIATQVLPGFGYPPDQIALIGGMIMATQLPQSPHILLEEILADADLDVLGRDDFMPRNELLRDELAAYGTCLTDEQWHQAQYKFISGHQYFTQAARTLRDEQKKVNIAGLKTILNL